MDNEDKNKVTYQSAPDAMAQAEAKKLLHGLVKGFLIFALVVASFFFGFSRGEKSIEGQAAISVPLKTAVPINTETPEGVDVDFSLFWKNWNLLREKFIDSGSLDANTLMYGAIKGMLRATGDPYTSFLDPAENKRFTEDLTGSFSGIGAEIGIRNEILTIIAPLPESPAQKAGLRAGDKILRINDEMTSEMSLEGAVANIRGDKGTDVRLTIFREGEDETREVTVTRDVIDVKSVELEFKEGDIAYVKLIRFGDDTSVLFRRFAREIINRKSQIIVLDLRNNPGGFLDTSVDVAGIMLESDKLVVIEEKYDGSQRKLLSRGNNLLGGIPTIVLINEGSASASEILAGALRDNREDVTLLGIKSFGKGSVQEYIELPRGAAVKITIAKWFTPNGRQIEKEGIEPDVEVDLTLEDFNEDRDPQLDRAMEMAREIIGR